ncbi:DNA adenine methylase [Marinospirillum minutulum]|uniref:DNA adenine methylase n=1 Tax=Marinospirillum minutulum TaxID=64974 RepID=UPI00040D6066|nr:DNA adenine methylase [Marinospirillum minutulum]
MHPKKIYSPLRYPGGKARFSPFVANLMKINGVTGGHYFEPYAGGAGVALYLLLEGHASHIHINDADPAIYSFWLAVTQHTGALLELLDSTPVIIEEWFKWRTILRDENNTNIVEKGFATLFMNRANRSGILKAGVIGGKEQSGEYKLDARFNKNVLISRIEKIAEKSNNITVYCEDSLSLLNRCNDFLPFDSLIYLDPPYYVKGKGLYRNFYEHDDHVQIAKVLQAPSFKQRWMVSYDNVKEICEMYSLSQSLSYGLNYSAQKHYVGSEVMFFSEGLLVPDENILQLEKVN